METGRVAGRSQRAKGDMGIEAEVINIGTSRQGWGNA